MNNEELLARLKERFKNDKEISSHLGIPLSTWGDWKRKLRKEDRGELSTRAKNTHTQMMKSTIAALLAE